MKKVLAEGKTKIIYELENEPGLVLIKSKDDITKNDDPSQTRTMEGKAVYSTTTACAVFSLLKKAGIPVAFERRFSETEFLAPKCEMILLEVIVRRYAVVGGYLSRFPNLKKEEGEPPHRFEQLVFELFLKTKDGIIKDRKGMIVEALPSDCLEIGKEKPIDDPLIFDPYQEIWHLRHPKIPEMDERADINSLVFQNDILPKGITVEMIEEITLKTFLALENAWARLGCRLIDFKIEFGIDPNGELLVADVIDNDSWRLKTDDWQELSKQLFRDNAEMGDIADKYALVARLVNKFAAQP